MWLATCAVSALRLEACGQDDHIHCHVIRLVVEGFVPVDNQLAVILLDVPHFAMVEMHAHLARAIVKLLVTFAEGAHIAVDLVYFGAHVFMHQLRELERVHAAGTRAVFVILAIPGADAMQDSDRPGRLPVFKKHFPGSRAAGVDQALEFHAR